MTFPSTTVDEAQYRAPYLQADIAQCRFALLVLMAPMAPFVYFDHALLGFSPLFYQLASARAAMFLYTLYVWHRLPQVGDARTLDTQLVVWALASTAMSLANNFTRPPEYFGHYITDVWLILMFYAAVPLPPRVQTPPVLVYAAFALAVLFLHKRAPIPLYTYIVVLMTVLSVWCGHLISARIHRYRREMLVTRIELERQARTDPLTGAINRREFARIAGEELARHARLGKPLSVLMLDLDHFKSVNDRFGHSAGDAVLVEVTHRTQAVLRSYDRLARTGGEEFCILLPEASPDEAQAIAERVRSTLSAKPIDANGSSVTITTSIGIANAKVGELQIEGLMQRADAALYSAKNAGRNRVALASA